MRLACRLVLGGSVGLSVVLGGGCFDPGSPVTPADEGSSGDSTGTTPTSASSPTATPSTETDPDPDTGTDTIDPPTTTDPDTSTTSPPVDCEGEGFDPSCPADQPFCSDGLCGDCTTVDPGACEGVDPTTPVCDGGVCSACTEHDQCSTGACRILTGECFPESNRLWVDNTFGGCAGGVGTEDNPFCQVVDAMDVIDGQAGTEPWAIFVAGSPNSYDGPIDPNSGKPVAVIGPDAGLEATIFNSSGYAVDQWSMSPETYLHRLTTERGSDGPAIRCAMGQVFVTDSVLRGSPSVNVTGCTLNLNRVSTDSFGMAMVVGGGEVIGEQVVLDNSSGGMAITGGVVELYRSVVSNNYVEGGIDVSGGTLSLVNSMVFNNQYQNDGVYATGGASVDVLHSTIVGALSCQGGSVDVTVRNSIVLDSFSAGMDCPAAEVHNSVVNSGLMQGMGNVMATMDDLDSIFVSPGMFGMSDFHVLPGSLPDGVAVHQAGDPLEDFDLDPRPVMAGAADYAGADVP